MDGRKLPDDPDPRWYGYSVGKWEGDTLVVESNGFNDKTWLGAQGQPHSDQMRTIERYRRIDASTIDFHLTIDDPMTYTKTWETEPRLIKSKPGRGDSGVVLRGVRRGGICQENPRARGPAGPAKGMDDVMKMRIDADLPLFCFCADRRPRTTETRHTTSRRESLSKAW